ncbi:MAG: glycosyltransferase family 2 protein [Clostridium sp.]
MSRRLLGKTFDYPDSCFAGRSAVYVGAVHGSMLMVDTEKFLEAGGYDEGIFLYEEEQVLGRRMQNAGYRSVLLLNQHYDHEHSTSISKSFSDAMKRQRLREKSTLLLHETLSAYQSAPGADRKALVCRDPDGNAGGEACGIKI